MRSPSPFPPSEGPLVDENVLTSSQIFFFFFFLPEPRKCLIFRRIFSKTLRRSLSHTLYLYVQSWTTRRWMFDISNIFQSVQWRNVILIQVDVFWLNFIIIDCILSLLKKRVYFLRVSASQIPTIQTTEVFQEFLVLRRIECWGNNDTSPGTGVSRTVQGQ